MKSGVERGRGESQPHGEGRASDHSRGIRAGYVNTDLRSMAVALSCGVLKVISRKKFIEC